MYGTQNIFAYSFDIATGLINTPYLNYQSAPDNCPIEQKLIKMAITPTHLFVPCAPSGAIASYPINGGGFAGGATVRANTGTSVTGINVTNIISVPGN